MNTAVDQAKHAYHIET